MVTPQESKTDVVQSQNDELQLLLNELEIIREYKVDVPNTMRILSQKIKELR